MTTRRPPAATGEQLGLVAEDKRPDDGYRCFAADPPWQEKGGSRGADKHYPLLPTSEIPRVMMQSPLWRPAANAHLWLWVTSNFGPRLEMFARAPRAGWDVWGNEVGGAAEDRGAA